jgi:hypothetical protein
LTELQLRSPFGLNDALLCSLLVEENFKTLGRFEAGACDTGTGVICFFLPRLTEENCCYFPRRHRYMFCRDVSDILSRSQNVKAIRYFLPECFIFHGLFNFRTPDISCDVTKCTVYTTHAPAAVSISRQGFLARMLRCNLYFLSVNVRIIRIIF